MLARLTLSKAALLLVLLGVVGAGSATASASCPPPSPAESLQYLSAILARMQRSGSASILVVGDSIAERWTALDRQSGMTVENWGASGDKPENLLWRLQQVRDERHRSAVIVVVGVNAAFRSPACTTVAASIEADVGELRRISPTSRLFVVGVMPYMPGLHASLHQITPINATLATDAARLGFTYVDAGQALMQDCLDRTVCPLLIDWLHPSDSGYSAMWRAVAHARGGTATL